MRRHLLKQRSMFSFKRYCEEKPGNGSIVDMIFFEPLSIDEKSPRRSLPSSRCHSDVDVSSPSWCRTSLTDCHAHKPDSKLHAMSSESAKRCADVRAAESAMFADFE